jgi:glycosyltransferase involved in cell wall biosynthesis
MHVCDDFASRMSLQYLVETAPGKNSALNSGIELASGRLLLFTDDDVFVDRDWMSAMLAAADDFPGHDVFGGRVLPDWPDDFPAYLRESRYTGVCFSILDGGEHTGPVKSFYPFGTNMGVRRSVFDSGVRYDTAVGPSQASYIMGSETSLVRTLAAKGQAPVYVGGSSVVHRVRPEQASLRWLLGRGVRYGRMLAYRDPADAYPRWLIREMAGRSLDAAWRMAKGDRTAGFEAAFEVAIARGKLLQHSAAR